MPPERDVVYLWDMLKAARGVVESVRVPGFQRSKLANLKPRLYLLSDPEDLVYLDWSGECVPDLSLIYYP